MKSASANPFSTAFLERRADSRRDPDWVAAALASPTTRVVVSRGTQHLVQHEPATRVAYLGIEHPAVRAARPEQLTELGWHGELRYVQLDDRSDFPLPPGTRFEELRPLLALLPHEELLLLANARALQVWRARHRHCGVCGARTVPVNAGHQLRCADPACATEFFPRIDPAVIVLVSAGEQVLMGRQASWPAGRYSALAGFVEAGETLEDAVIREVFEETGVRVSEVGYFASQPWPFPSSLMLGFHAVGEPSTPIALDGELESARWFHADELQAAAASGLLLPPPHTIARHLIEAWFQNVTGRALS